ncbi:hypothetical protein HRbin10_02231 [bacterium HR10]|nr:hypothetical protein HRbin10_02231 [bacterium HR10]
MTRNGRADGRDLVHAPTGRGTSHPVEEPRTRLEALEAPVTSMRAMDLSSVLLYRTQIPFGAEPHARPLFYPSLHTRTTIFSQYLVKFFPPSPRPQRAAPHHRQIARFSSRLPLRAPYAISRPRGNPAHSRIRKISPLRIPSRTPLPNPIPRSPNFAPFLVQGHMRQPRLTVASSGLDGSGAQRQDRLRDFTRRG